MRPFEHIDAGSIDEAVARLTHYAGAAKVMAGGTDLLGCLKDDLYLQPPKAIINLKTIPSLNYVREEEDGLKIGSLTTLMDIAESPVIQEKYAALAEAAGRTASPLLRNLATLAGNICQENRCWYYRYPSSLGGRMECVRKGGEKCFAVKGDSRYHSIFGAVKKCIAVNPSDTAPALVVLGATIRTSKRAISASEFFSAKNGVKSTVLDDDEIVTEIHLPPGDPGRRSAFRKIALRKTIDFAILNCAVSLVLEEGQKVSAARICLNGVHNNPYEPADVENVLMDRDLTEESALAAGNAAVAKAKPLPSNRYKIQMAKILVADTLLACRDLQFAGKPC